MKITFVAWTNYERRSELLAQHLSATMHFIYYGQGGNIFQAPMRYLIQTLQTWKTLTRERPNVIFVQNPPVFAVLVAYLYCKWYGARYVIDSHTSAFLMPRWYRFRALHRWLSKRALLEIVHNKSQEAMIKNWNCNYHRIGFTPGVYPVGEPFPFDGKFNIAMPSTFHDDEPLDIVFDAASQMPDVDFYITGDSKNIVPTLFARKPENCHLTGFLSYDQYVGLLRGADIVLDLTTRDHTVLSGAFEAISLGKPLIVSDWDVLRDYFSMGTIHIPNTAEGVCKGVRQAQRELISLQDGILKLNENLQLEWDHKFKELCQLLAESQDQQYLLG